jgi:phosphohistidine swiveling domain-containing protein
MKVMVSVKRISILGALALALVLTGCGGGGGGGCLLGNALCDKKTPANVAPIARSAPPQSVLLGQPVVFDGSASSDANGDTLSYSWTWVSKPEGSLASMDSATSAKPKFTVDLPGLYAASLVVRDGKTSSESALAVVSGFELNAPPVAATGANQSVLTGSAVTLDGSASTDANRDRLTYKWSLISKPTGSTAELLKPLEVKASFTADVAGVYVAGLVVNDGKLPSESAVVLVQVSDKNAAPVARTGPSQNVEKGSQVTLDGSGSSDENNDRLTYKWQLISTPSGSAAALSDDASPRPVFTADVAGVYVASLAVSDGVLFSAPASVSVTVEEKNLPPTADAGAPQSVLVGAVVKLDGLGSSDPNRDALKYKWAMVSAPAGSAADVSPKDAVRTTFTADLPGVYVVGLAVSDDRLFSEMVAVTITASAANGAPTALAGAAQNVLKGASVGLDGSGSSDPNGDALNYRWSLVSAPAGSAATLNNTAAAKPTFSADVSGVYVLSLVVSDGLLSSAPSTVTVTASSSNLPPVANAGTEQTVRVGDVVRLSGSGSTDANGDVLTYLWTWTSNPDNGILTGASTVAPSFTPSLAGIYVLTLTVNDGKGGSHVARVLINVE